MPTQVQKRPSEHMTRSMSEKFHDHGHVPINKNAQHKEALRLALGSILAPKRPFTPSRSSSGTASPAYPYQYQSSGPHSGPVSSTPYSDGQQTPDHHPHSYNYHAHHHHPHRPAAPHHGHSHPHSHAHTPSRLAMTESNYASGEQSPASRLASIPGTPPAGSLPASPRLQPSPPPTHDMPPLSQPSPLSLSPGSCPTSEPPSPRTDGDTLTQPHQQGTQAPKQMPWPTPIQEQQREHRLHAPASATSSPQLHAQVPPIVVSSDGTSTPKAKFLETLQSNRAWEALIHGSFS